MSGAEVVRHAWGRLRGQRTFDPERHWQARVAQFRADNRKLSQRDEDQLVLLGDSLTEGLWPRALHWLHPRLVNRGVSSDHLGHEGPGDGGMLRRIDPESFVPRPRRIFVLAGINDLADEPADPRKVLLRYGQLLRELRRLYPNTHIRCQTLLPTRGDYAHLNGGVSAINAGLGALAREHGASVLPLHALFVDGAGQLARSYSKDGLHLTRLAYVRWLLALRAELRA